MYRLDGHNIELTRGDSLLLLITLPGRELPQGTLAVFTVKTHPRSETAILTKALPVENGRVELELGAQETDLPARLDYWDLRLMIPGVETEILTPMDYAALTILEVIGDV